MRENDEWHTVGITVGEPATRLSIDEPDREPETVLTNKIHLNESQSEELFSVLEASSDQISNLEKEEQQEQKRMLAESV